jgi:ATP-dependent DNA ligase
VLQSLSKSGLGLVTLSGESVEGIPVEAEELPVLRLDRRAQRVGKSERHVGREEFVFAGKVGTGFDTRFLLALRARLEGLEIPTPAFTRAIGLPRVSAHWVRPEIVVEVAFIEWTVNGKLRHPRFLGVRTDKTAREVVRERA